MSSSNGDNAWASLVRRSIEAQKEIRTENTPKMLDILQQMQKWSRDRLDDYVLLPATPGFTRDDPDPDGKYLRLHQNELQSQSWSYVWVDWSCIPQHPRSDREGVYFLPSLQTMPSIIRNSGFAWFYPRFEPRLWILFKIAEHILTSEGGLQTTHDSKEIHGTHTGDATGRRALVDRLTWQPVGKVTMTNTPSGVIDVCRYEETLELNGIRHTFTPLPR
ncbi:hypothetical protein B0T14DRAFT_536793 [Immersiella caudata]|uniref:Uncharacterized protein n=1 Tax=Immersiella caudata TaxID=314043 RepID=A0AA39WZ49_9PEZI|nr:hypothetical protein B0T14DRAFT_536793 [Immersiella caudata]